MSWLLDSFAWSAELISFSCHNPTETNADQKFIEKRIEKKKKILLRKILISSMYVESQLKVMKIVKENFTTAFLLPLGNFFVKIC